jgi:hypothetical protein
MTTTTRSRTEQPLPSVEIESSGDATRHADLRSTAMSMGFFHSHGTDAENTVTSARGDFCHALVWAGSF